MSLWQFALAVDGWNKAHGGDDEPPAMTGEEYDALIEKHADWLAQA